jgi:hypothetical protein
MMKGPEWYKILGVSESASEDEIKRSYRKLVKELHPDRDTSHETRFKEVTAAYAILSDTKKRAEYDTGLEEERLREKAHERAERIQKEREARKPSDAETKEYGEKIRGESSASGETPPWEWWQPPTGQPPRTTPPRQYPPPARPPSAPPPTKSSTPARRHIIYKLAMKLGLLVGAIAFAGAPFGIMALMVPFENANEHNMLVDVFGLAVGLTCIVWILAGIPVVFAALSNLFTDWSE